MSRINNDSNIDLPPPGGDPEAIGNPAVFNSAFAQGDVDTDIEKQLLEGSAAIVRDFPTAGGENSDWQTGFAHVGGSGHGHEFHVWVDAANAGAGSPISVNGANNIAAALQMAVYIAETKAALADARQRAVERFVARAEALLTGGQEVVGVTVKQSWLCGASKGTRVMGVNLLEPVVSEG